MKPAKRPRPSFPLISEEMKAWSAALRAEATGWPQVSTRSFFGFTALYRQDSMFALLPRTRGMDSPDTLAFRFDALTTAIRLRLTNDHRVGSADLQKARWFTFKLSSGADLHDALGWLEQAYEATAKNKKSK